MAFQLVLMEAREAIEDLVRNAQSTSPEAAMLIRIGLLNYAAGALLMPYEAFLTAAQSLRHDMEALASRFGVSFEQACNRLSTLQRPGALRGAVFLPAGQILRVTYRNALPQRAIRLPVTVGRARAGLCTMLSPNPGPCWFRSRNCRTVPRICALRERFPVHPAGGVNRSRCTSLPWAAL